MYLDFRKHLEGYGKTAEISNVSEKAGKNREKQIFNAALPVLSFLLLNETGCLLDFISFFFYEFYGIEW